MILEFSVSSNDIEIKNDLFKFKFQLDQQIDLTDFVKYISESESNITIKPDRTELLKSENSDDCLKLLDYVFKIIDAFNETFFEVYSLPKNDLELF
ncbi:MAG: hypothetical protein ABSC11_14460 [Smithella sp.]|jgi:hypothetical protein